MYASEIVLPKLAHPASAGVGWEEAVYRLYENIFTIWEREDVKQAGFEGFLLDFPPLSLTIYHCKGDIYNRRTLYIKGSCLPFPFAEIMTLRVVDCCYL